MIMIRYVTGKKLWVSSVIVISVTTEFFIIVTFVSYTSSPCFVLLNHPVTAILSNKKYKGKRGRCKVKKYSKTLLSITLIVVILISFWLVRTSYKAQIAHKAVSCTKGITCRYMRFELQIVPGFNHCQLKAGINCSHSSFLYLQCSSCQYFSQTK
jgi:hypothetical protein